jgi:hypothetical protein
MAEVIRGLPDRRKQLLAIEDRKVLGHLEPDRFDFVGSTACAVDQGDADAEDTWGVNSVRSKYVCACQRQCQY